jgi:hypothetical protein
MRGLNDLKDRNIMHLFELMQHFTDTEFVVNTLVKKIVNDAYDITERHKFPWSRTLGYEKKVEDDEVYDLLIEKYSKEIEKIQERIVNLEDTNKEQFLHLNLNFSNVILIITKNIKECVIEGIENKQKIKSDLSKDGKSYKEDYFQNKLRRFYVSVQVYPFIKYRLPNDEYRYSDRF